MSYVVSTSARKRYPYEVTWNGGKVYCQCTYESDAEAIALALNIVRSLKQRGTERLTSAEIGAIGIALRAKEAA